MAEFSTKRIVAVAAISGALIGGVVAGLIAELSTHTNDAAASTTGDSGSLSIATVVRTTLSTTEQVGGSISYKGSYTVVAPSGFDPQQISQEQQAVTADEQSVSASEQSEFAAASGDKQQISADQTDFDNASATLNSDRAEQAKDCAGKEASSPNCNQDRARVSQDESQLTQAQQQLVAGRSNAIRDNDQNSSQVQSAEAKLADDKAMLSSMQKTAANPGSTYTYLPQVGASIKEDQTLYSLDNVPVPLLYGSITAYRAFYVGMSAGADVGELTHDLISLGFGSGMTQSNTYSSATTAAVERWQKARGLPQTGEILLGEVAFEPGPLRVTSVSLAVGNSLGGGNGSGGGTVLTATGTTPIVTVDLDVSEEYLVKPGDSVSIVLPNGSTTVGGRVESVGNVATCPSGSGVGNGGSNGSGSADQSPCASGGSSNNPTVQVTITMDSDRQDASLDQAPVNVNITSQQVNNVLALPVTALLALQGGGYGVDVVEPNGTVNLVAVNPGLYDNTLVQVSGAGIGVGTKVQVPSQ